MGENIFSKSITVLVLLSTFIAQHALGQFTDDFNDGNFTHPLPAWSGEDGEFIVNGAHQLQTHINPAIAGSSSLSKPFTIPNNYNVLWEFLISHTFSGSGSNNSRVYLMSSSSNFIGSLNGYYLQFGEDGANDAVRLIRQTGTIHQTLISGTAGQIAGTFTIGVRVTKSAVGEWQLLIDPSGGTNFTATQVVVDNTFTTSNFFGVRCLYTVSNTEKFFFDDFIIETTPAPDVTAPQLMSVSVISDTQIDLNFSETLNDTEALSPGDFILNDTVVAVSASFERSDSTIRVTFDYGMKNGHTQKILFPAVEDLTSNLLPSNHQNFLYFKPVAVQPHDIVINEVYPDPSPSIGLPPYEFIEIYNRSGSPFQLAAWKITDGSTVGVLQNRILLPGEYLILVPNEALSSYSLFGAALGLQIFPTLNNSGDKIQLISPEGVEIDLLSYTLANYHDEDKNAGGHTIERINPNDFCSESENWKASTNESGGTPGQINSVFALTEDKLPPEITSVAVVAADSIIVFFSEKLSKDAADGNNFSFEPLINFDTVDFTDNLLRNVGIKLTESIDPFLTYRVVVSNITDCPGNPLTPDTTIKLRLDNLLPKVESVITKNDTQVVVRFSEEIKTDGEMVSKFSLENTPPDSVVVMDAFSVELNFKKFVNGKRYVLQISGVEDLSGNVIEESEHFVLYFEAHPVSPKDVIITEIFSDPTPAQGLPETEFIEILNRSANPVKLENWTLSDDGHQVKIKPYILLAGEYLTLTSSSKAFQFQNALGLASFPTLTNAGEALVLRDSLGMIIDSVFYSDEWYRDQEKADGGWTLELIDPNNTCAEGENWTASEDISGGTPGKVNSVIAEKPDLTPPELVSVVAIAEDAIVVTFNEKLGNQIPRAEEIVITPAVTIDKITFSDQTKRSYSIRLSIPLTNRVRYSITMNNVSDCAGNVHKHDESLYFALPEKAEASDIIVNEILFNPRPTGIDFLELYNRSEKYVNLKNWQVANFVNDTIVNRKQISEIDFVFEPGDFLVLTSDPNLLKGEYLQARQEKMKKVTLPTLSDDEGSVVILDEHEGIIDTLFYSKDQHSPFLKDTEGISLERVDINSPTSNRSNWQSASASSGYATPGLENGNVLQNIFEDAVSVEPEIFSPASGQSDFAMIAYNFEHAGYVANVKIVNQQGRVIKTVAENELLGADGFFIWSGDTSQGNKATVGAYMVWFEAFDDRGTVVTLKKRVVIAEKF